MNTQPPIQASGAKLLVVKPIAFKITDEQGKSQDVLSGSIRVRGASHREFINDDAHDDESNFFALAVECALSPSTLLITTEKECAWYVTQYRLRMKPLDMENNPDIVLDATSPQNSNKSKEISVSATTSWGVSIGPTSGGSFTSNSSTTESYPIDDMDVTNESRQLTAEWAFDMQSLPKTGPTFRQILEKPKKLQCSTAQIYCVAEWKTEALKNKSLAFEIEIAATFAHTHIQERKVSTLDSILDFTMQGHELAAELEVAALPAVTVSKRASMIVHAAVDCQSKTVAGG